MSHHGKTVVVTGAGSGLGAVVARRFAAAGSRVACVDLDPGKAGAVADSAATRGHSAVAFGADVSREAEVARLHEDVRDALGQADMLFNIAGVLYRRQMADLDVPAFRRVVDVNLTGTYAMTREFAPDLISRGWGRIVNVASIAGVNGYPFPAYAAAKAAIANLTRSLLVDFWGTGVTVNAVSPGAMDTPMLDRESKPAFLRKTPAGRMAGPDDVAAAIDFLASDNASLVNGQNLVLDGGATSVFRYDT